MTDVAPPGSGDEGDDALTALASIEPIDIQEEMERSFLEYAMAVIVDRALPDARDGMKPGGRRILFGMHDQGVRPDRAHVKCARVVGDVVGKYHPHSPEAVYDSLARLAQDFSLRHPLVDGHGNFGSPHDPPGAMRYCISGSAYVCTPSGTHRIADLAPALPNSEIDIELKVWGRSGEPVVATKAFHSGQHPTLRLRTPEGFELEGTHNHPVLCLVSVMGVPMLLWKLLEEVKPGDFVALARAVHVEDGDLTEREWQLATLAGALISEGWASEKRAGFNNTDEQLYDEVVAAWDACVGGTRYLQRRSLPSGKTCHELDVQKTLALADSELSELMGKHAADKRVPDLTWRGNPAFKRAFLQALFEGDGSCSDLGNNTIQISYSTFSKQLAKDVQQLLLELGVVSRLCVYAKGEFKVVVTNQRDARLFAANVGFFGVKQAKLEAILASFPAKTAGAHSSDRIPFLSGYIRAESGRGGREWLSKHNIDRWERWDRYGDVILAKINNDEVVDVIRPIVESGYYFATIESVEDAGVQPVYSLRIDSDDHAFITNGFVSHNTECRLAPLAMHMLAGIDEGTVDMNPNYDGKETEPAVLPARFPNLLVNGGTGIGVAMASNIAPHNLGEVIDATIHLIDNPEATVEDLMQFVKGPDFPGGGLILGRQGILDAYRTGRGSIKMRARAEIEEGKRNQVIIVTEIPYQTSVEGIADKAAELVNAKMIDGIRDIRNERANRVNRLVFELKRDANAHVVLNNLYKQTPMQTSFGVNAVALVDGIPRTLGLVEMLRVYIEHQVEVITRRSQYRLDKAQKRAHLVEGLLKALDHIDAIVALIRGSEDKAAARAGLMAQPFEFSEVQAEHILDLTLARLTRLARSDYETEMAQLRETIADLNRILNDPIVLRQVIKDELTEIRNDFATPRRSEITWDPGEIGLEDLIDDEPLVFTMTKTGYTKTVAADAFRTQARGGKGIRGTKLKEDDLVTQIVHTTAHAFLLFFSNKGRVFRLKAHEVPMKERTARGTHINNLLPMAPDEHVQAVIETREYRDDQYLFFATKKGTIKKTAFSEYDKSRREGFIAINLRDGDELVKVIRTGGTDDVFMVTRNGMNIRFSEEDMRPTGRSAAGVRGIRLKADDEVVSCDVARDDVAILIVTDQGYGKRTQLDRFNRQGRGGMGVRGIKLTARKGYVVAAFMVGLGDEIFLISSGGTTMRIPVRDISSQGRDATGVRVMNVGADERVASVAPIINDDEEE